MNLHWPKSPAPGNLGDIISPYLYEKITGTKPVWCSNKSSPKIMMSGSTMHYVKDGDHVFGTGIMWSGSALAKAKYYFVRGPLTRQRVLACGGECPKIYCDPGLLLPFYYNPDIKIKYPVGVIPHYVDYVDMKQQYPHLKVINVLDANIEHVINQILECQVIYSSSLHGIIISHAYGVQTAWIRPSDKLCGDDVKFKDYAESVSIHLVPCKIGEEKYLRIADSNYHIETAKSILEESLITL